MTTGRKSSQFRSEVGRRPAFFARLSPWPVDWAARTCRSGRIPLPAHPSTPTGNAQRA
ncbi:hypothetical protein IG631_19429 [Alternaria alternata]|nr:hypothetical protein IG631_19429 [Alternaria alternata]